ncbi:hypothetical protein M747DRAFT_248964 [Aspergillus niger ATCC 13496]|uniref:Uncharacterized protein n=3 Tax=Aspergillus niger TaxID=5061 RepID=A2QV43_ASPNC|nr:hypothetical protein An10g00940 [Aspergillus niger]RDH14680.1 hypothetical protein M747DRAFT_248964 [Aspergillus niger ATCC 13496]CAK40530.1 hypothetical protein An10g00940 [Aspergillus niger]
MEHTVCQGNTAKQCTGNDGVQVPKCALHGRGHRASRYRLSRVTGSQTLIDGHTRKLNGLMVPCVNAYDKPVYGFLEKFAEEVSRPRPWSVCGMTTLSTECEMLKPALARLTSGQGSFRAGAESLAFANCLLGSRVDHFASVVDNMAVRQLQMPKRVLEAETLVGPSVGCQGARLLKRRYADSTRIRLDASHAIVPAIRLRVSGAVWPNSGSM